MKTTLEIDDALLLAAKRAALDRRTTLRALVEAGLKKELTTKPGRRRPLKLITHPGGLPPELNLSNRRAMREWFDAVDETSPHFSPGEGEQLFLSLGAGAR